MEIITLITGLLFIGLGFLIKAFPDLIAGYNTMSKEKKEKVDIEGLSKYMRNGFIIIGFVIIAGTFIFKWIGLYEFSYYVLLISIIGGVIILVIGAQKYDLNEKKNNRYTYILLIIVTLFVASILLYNSRPTEIIIKDSMIKITGSYGFEMNISDISEVKLQETIPAILLRTNGYSSGKVKKGNFELEKYGKSKLFFQTDKGPFLIITDKEGNKTILNYKNSNKTEEKYKEINSLVSN